MATRLPSPPVWICSSATTSAPVSRAALQHGFFVQWLDGGHIQHACLNALAGQRFGGFQRGGDHQPHGNDGEIRALAQLIGFTDGELGNALRINDRRFRAPGANVHGALMPRGGAHGGVHLKFVTGRQHDKTVQRAGQREILDALLRDAVFADAHAGVRAAEFGIFALIGHAHAQLIVALAEQEGGKAGGEGNEPAGSEAGGHARPYSLR